MIGRPARHKQEIREAIHILDAGLADRLVGSRREFHDGRFGYWFVVDGIWYFYDQPIYPYPTFVPEIVYIPEEDYEPPVYVDAPPEAPPAPYGQPATYYYYFCQDTQTYYPYVTSCASPWQPVPATPQ